MQRLAIRLELRRVTTTTPTASETKPSHSVPPLHFAVPLLPRDAYQASVASFGCPAIVLPHEGGAQQLMLLHYSDEEHEGRAVLQVRVRALAVGPLLSASDGRLPYRALLAGPVFVAALIVLMLLVVRAYERGELYFIQAYTVWAFVERASLGLDPSISGLDLSISG